MKTFLAPDYLNCVRTAGKCRLAVSKGQDYVNLYLKQFSERETDNAFMFRKEITPNPPDLRIALNQLLYSIRARMGDVYRESNLAEYIDAANGVNRGVDGRGSTMVSFISNEVLKELLVAGRVGIFVNRDEVPTTLAEEAPTPYLSIVPTEDILNLSYDKNNQLIGVVLKTYDVIEEDGFPIKETYYYDQYRTDGKLLTHTRYNNQGQFMHTVTSDLGVLPFTLLQIEDAPVPNALYLHDALMQLSSTDFIFLFKSNHPIYVEQFSVKAEMQERQAKRERERDGEVEADVGTVTGRRYAENLEAPSFISPKVDHLEASEFKQEKITKQIERMLTIESFDKGYKQASAETKREDKEPLVGNIQKLFDELEKAEKGIAKAWHAYYGVPISFTVEYPTTFDLRTETARLDSAEKKLKLRDDVSSQSFKKIITLEAVRDIIPTASLRELREIQEEINTSELNITMSQLVRLIAEDALHPEQSLTALGLDAAAAQKVIDYSRERLEFIQSIQTGTPNTPHAEPTKPGSTNDAD